MFSGNPQFRQELSKQRVAVNSLVSPKGPAQKAQDTSKAKPQTNQSEAKKGLDVLEFIDGTYEGNTLYCKRHGFGVFWWDSGEFYFGEWANDTMNGYGTLYFPGNGSVRGSFKNGKLSGGGIVKFHNGDLFEGYWTKGKLDGKCLKFFQETQSWIVNSYNMGKYLKTVSSGEGVPPAILPANESQNLIFYGPKLPKGSLVSSSSTCNSVCSTGGSFIRAAILKGSCKKNSGVSTANVSQSQSRAPSNTSSVSSEPAKTTIYTFDTIEFINSGQESKYQGVVYQGKPNGLGIILDRNGQFDVGFFCDGFIDGIGLILKKNNSFIFGEMSQGRLLGRGLMFSANENSWIRGTFREKERKIHFEGEGNPDEEIAKMREEFRKEKGIIIEKKTAVDVIDLGDSGKQLVAQPEKGQMSLSDLVGSEKGEASKGQSEQEITLSESQPPKTSNSQATKQRKIQEKVYCPGNQKGIGIKRKSSIKAGVSLGTSSSSSKKPGELGINKEKEDGAKNNKMNPRPENKKEKETQETPVLKEKTKETDPKETKSKEESKLKEIKPKNSETKENKGKKTKSIAKAAEPIQEQSNKKQKKSGESSANQNRLNIPNEISETSSNHKNDSESFDAQSVQVTSETKPKKGNMRPSTAAPKLSIGFSRVENLLKGTRRTPSTSKKQEAPSEGSNNLENHQELFPQNKNQHETASTVLLEPKSNHQSQNNQKDSTKKKNSHNSSSTILKASEPDLEPSQKSEKNAQKSVKKRETAPAPLETHSKPEENKKKEKDQKPKEESGKLKENTQKPSEKDQSTGQKESDLQQKLSAPHFPGTNQPQNRVLQLIGGYKRSSQSRSNDLKPNEPSLLKESRPASPPPAQKKPRKDKNSTPVQKTNTRDYFSFPKTDYNSKGSPSPPKKSPLNPPSKPQRFFTEQNVLQKQKPSFQFGAIPMENERKGYALSKEEQKPNEKLHPLKPQVPESKKPTRPSSAGLPKAMFSPNSNDPQRNQPPQAKLVARNPIKTTNVDLTTKKPKKADINSVYFSRDENPDDMLAKLQSWVKNRETLLKQPDFGEIMSPEENEKETNDLHLSPYQSDLEVKGSSEFTELFPLDPSKKPERNPKSNSNGEKNKAKRNDLGDSENLKEKPKPQSEKKRKEKKLRTKKTKEAPESHSTANNHHESPSKTKKESPNKGKPRESGESRERLSSSRTESRLSTVEYALSESECPSLSSGESSDDNEKSSSSLQNMFIDAEYKFNKLKNQRTNKEGSQEESEIVIENSSKMNFESILSKCTNLLNTALKNSSSGNMNSQEEEEKTEKNLDEKGKKPKRKSVEVDEDGDREVSFEISPACTGKEQLVDMVIPNEVILSQFLEDETNANHN